MFTLFLDSGTQVVFRGSVDFCFFTLKRHFWQTTVFQTTYMTKINNYFIRN